MATFSGSESSAPGLRHVAAGRRGTTAQLTAVLDALLDIRPRRTPLDFEEFACIDGLLFGRTVGAGDFRHYLGPRIELLEAVEWMAGSLAVGPRERAYLLTKIAEIPDIESAIFDDDARA